MFMSIFVLMHMHGAPVPRIRHHFDQGVGALDLAEGAKAFTR